MSSFNPSYQLSDLLLSSLLEIERLYGQLEALRIPKKLELNLKRDNLLKSSYISNSIEGNPLSYPEVTNLILDERIPANRNEQEIRNYFDILSTLKKFNDKRITIKTVCDIHKTLMYKTDDDIAGVFRSQRVIVGGYFEYDGIKQLNIKHEPPFHSYKKISAAMTDLFRWIEANDAMAKIVKVGIFHHRYLYIHPFADGNGRTCRLMTALLLFRYGYLINKYFVLDDYYDLDRNQYSDKLSSADKGDLTEWLEYFTLGMKYSLASALDRVEHALKLVEIEHRPSSREKEVLNYLQVQREVTSRDVANYLDCSRQHAHRLLSSLVEKGYLQKIGDTKGSYYRLK